jgi:FMN phosphatase YigB (HAD superfamily)
MPSRLLENAGLASSLQRFAFSDEVGVPKPEPSPFLAALAGLQVDLAEVVHVGDLRRSDVAGAPALGTATIRIRAHFDDETGWPDADHTVDSYAELGALLGIGGR